MLSPELSDATSKIVVIADPILTVTSNQALKLVRAVVDRSFLRFTLQ